MCAICGQFGPLTKEHVAPRKAFNDGSVLFEKMEGALPSGEVRWRDRTLQGGNWVRTLCDKCNTLTGHWYGQAYVEFSRRCAEACERVKRPEESGTASFRIAPSRVAKEALAIFCSACGPSLASEHVGLQSLILDPKVQGLLTPLRLYAYLCLGGKHEKGAVVARSSGKARVVNLPTGAFKIVAEFAYWPVGWVLSFTDQRLPLLAEVTHWLSDYGYEDTPETVHVSLVAHEINTALPLDYRTREQVEKEIETHADSGRVKSA